MRLLQHCDTGDFSLTEFDDGAIPPYAILSHTWGTDAEEVNFTDLTTGTGKDKLGYKKIRFCGEQARKDGLQYFWVDTCCIDQTNKAELSRAINSMFRWYRNAGRCYVYLSDVSSPSRPSESNSKQLETDFKKGGWFAQVWKHLLGVSSTSSSQSEPNSQQLESDFRKSRWFTRGWTLQELLAPSSLEFFSQEWNKLGDRVSLKRDISEITGVPVLALEGALLSQFSDEDRFFWMEHRQTKVEEDKLYALLGIFDVNIPLSYGEGRKSALKRLQKEIDKVKKCMQDLRLTDPYDDKKRIEDAKGGLLKDSYCWILKNPDFQAWRNDRQSQLLWIKGDPGKGKTMLLCGIINELKQSMNQGALLSYFFCQATDSRINNASSVLRGLLYLLVKQQPSLISHIRKKYDTAGKALFDDANAWMALSAVFANVLQDPNLYSTYLIIDALDECVVDLPKLLNFIAQMSSVSPSIKWIVSSRNWPVIEKDLDTAKQKAALCLELNETSISAAVATYIQFKVDWLAKRNNYTTNTRDAVQRYLSLKANGTFLWVALVCQGMANVSEWNAQQRLSAFPSGLDSLYKRMIDQIMDSEDAGLCKRILAVISAVFRPITLDELASFVDMPNGVAGEYKALFEIIKLCGSFLTLQERTISFVHQSAKEFLLDKASNKILPSVKETHYQIFSRSLKAMSKTLRRDVYGLIALDSPIELVNQPDPDPLVALRYSVIYWIDHLYDWNSGSGRIVSQDKDAIEDFIIYKYLYWLEALSLFESMSKGVLAIAKLHNLVQGGIVDPSFLTLLQDARLFIMYHIQAIQKSPLQVYVSALMFSPESSLIRNYFKKEEPKGIIIKAAIGGQWSTCLQTLKGHSGSIWSVAFSHDSARLASASVDKTVKIWDASSGECLRTLKGHTNYVWSVAFSHDSARLASASEDRTVKIWDASSGECIQTLKGHSNSVSSVAFSHNSARLASASEDKTVKIWDASSGECLRTLKGHNDYIWSVTFSHDSAWLASASGDGTVKIWDANSGECLRTLKGHSDYIRSVAFSHDSAWLASASGDGTVKIWDANSGECLRTLEGHSDSISSVAFSHDSARLASASDDMTVKIWDVNNGECLRTLEGHSYYIRSIAFSHDSARLASASMDETVKIWDASSGEYLQTLEEHSDSINLVAFSYNSARLASASDDMTVKIWDSSSGECLWTLEGHSDSISSVVFSYDSSWLASISEDKMVKIWDASNGECLWTLEGHSDYISSVAFSHDSAWLASASIDETVKIWDASSGECLRTLKGHSDYIRSVAFSHDSAWLASASGDGTVKIWNASSGECIQTLKGHSNSVWSVAFSHDSARLASASEDETVKIWDASSGECLRTLKGHSDYIRSVAFSHDSAWLASASGDETVKIWNTNSSECIQTIAVQKVLFHISFDTRNNSCLHTEIGTFEIRTLSSLMPLPNLEPQSPRYQGLALSANDIWITHDSENLVWIPPEYRPYCSAALRNVIAVGTETGKVWICKIDPNLF